MQSYISEIQPRRERKPPAGYRVVGLVRSRRIGSRQSSEVDVIDIRATVDEIPSRIIHHADGIHADFKFLSFTEANPFHQVDI